MNTANRTDYQRIAAAIEWIAAHRHEQPQVAEMAAAVGLSESQFSRLFRRWAGITPQRYLAALTLAEARRALRANGTVEQAAWDSGLSGAGRLHDLFVRIDAVTPGEFKRFGEGLTLSYAFADTCLGAAFVASSERGIVALTLADTEDRAQRLAAFQQQWPAARLIEDAALGKRLPGWLCGEAATDQALAVCLVGTAFQHKVWQALLEIAPGETTSYGELAAAVGQPGASRAVGSALGNNPVAVLIPCHRVLRANGALGGYRWGEQRKRAALARELCAAIDARASLPGH